MVVLSGHKHSLLTWWLKPWATREKFTCAGVLNVCGFGAVITPPVAHKAIAIAIAWKRKSLQLGFTKKVHKFTVHPNAMPATICLVIANMTKTRLMWQKKDTISVQFSGQLVRLLHWILWKVDSLFAVRVCWDGDFCPSFSRLFVQSLFDSDCFGVVFTLFHRTVFTLAVEYQYPTVFTYFMFFCGANVCVDFFQKKNRRSVRRLLRPIQSRAVTL